MRFSYEKCIQPLIKIRRVKMRFMVTIVIAYIRSVLLKSVTFGFAILSDGPPPWSEVFVEHSTVNCPKYEAVRLTFFFLNAHCKTF